MNCKFKILLLHGANVTYVLINWNLCNFSKIQKGTSWNWNLDVYGKVVAKIRRYWHLRLIMMSSRRWRSRWTMNSSSARIRNDVTVLATSFRPRFAESIASTTNQQCVNISCVCREFPTLSLYREVASLLISKPLVTKTICKSHKRFPCDKNGIGLALGLGQCEWAITLQYYIQTLRLCLHSSLIFAISFLKM